MSPGAAKRRDGGKLRRLVVRFAKDRRGNTALEFAFIAIPFLAVIFAVFQTAMVYVSGSMMQTAVTDVARLVRTGQAKAMTAADFRNAICSRITVTFNCQSMLLVDVKSYSSFASAPAPSVPVVGGQIDTTTFGTNFNLGTGGSVVVLRTAISYPLVLPMIGTSMANLNGNKMLIMASAAFKNEAF
ncbi:pilus assembly protein [Alsobacter sp. SYSU M60028]|uniref:Pilus assembly protein n=1 Tax=Alsobacter ponti TaxID=2962936 RepID=A0ABT1LD03_9HYPH|nr:pilus assembly protein [Alsobacter ponti]